MTRSTPTITPTPARSLPVAEAYDQWAAVYDTDGNFLQALDDLELNTLLPQFLSSLEQPSDQQQQQLLVDLGCGTGRNTLKLLDLAPRAKIIGLELSSKMLDLARAKTEIAFNNLRTTTPITTTTTISKPDFFQYDMLDPSTPLPAAATGADAVISTLVMEHIPLSTFFHTAVTLLKTGGGKLLVTNMHPAMGAISQAGFVDPQTGGKVQTTSFVHGIGETVDAAREAGLRVVGEVRERRVDERVAGMLGRRGAKWIGVDCWFGIVFEKVG